MCVSSHHLPGPGSAVLPPRILNTLGAHCFAPCMACSWNVSQPQEKGWVTAAPPRAGNGMEAAQEIRVTLLGCSLARAATDSQLLFRHCSLLHPLFPQHPLPGLPRGMRNAGNAAAGTAGATFQLFSTASPPVPWKPGSCGFLWACLASPGSRDSLECLSILRE